MKTLIFLLITTLSLFANEQKQTLVFNNKPLNIVTNLDANQFNPNKGTLTAVTIQSKWTISDNAPYDVQLGLLLPDGVDIDNEFIDNQDRSWGLGVGITEPDRLVDYVGNGNVPLIVHFTEVSDAGNAKASLTLTVTYTYTP